MKKVFVFSYALVLLLFFNNKLIFTQQSDTSSYFPLGLWGIWIDSNRPPFSRDLTQDEWDNEIDNWNAIHGNYLVYWIPYWVQDEVLDFADANGYKMDIANWYYWSSSHTMLTNSLYYWMNYRPLSDSAQVTTIINNMKSEFGSHTAFYNYTFGQEGPVNNPNLWPKVELISRKIHELDPGRKSYMVSGWAPPQGFVDATPSLDILQMDAYFFFESIGQNYNDQQTALDNYLIQYNNTINRLKNKHTEWHAIIQAQREYRQVGCPSRRRPNLYELRVQAYLALSRGARGITSFVYGSFPLGGGSLSEGESPGYSLPPTELPQSNMADPCDVVLEYIGIVDVNRDPFTSLTDPDNIPGFENLSTLHNELQPIGATIRKLKFYDAFPNTSVLSNNSIGIYSVSGNKIEIGAFKKMDEGTDSTNYFIVVNRVCNNTDGSVSAPQSINIVLNGYQAIIDKRTNQFYAGTFDAVNNRTAFTVSLGPGEGKLFAFDRATQLANSNKSLNQAATGNNNGRKVVKDGSGNYHMVFASGGEIFYRKTTNGGTSWLPPNKLSLGNGNNNFPSISESGGRLYAIWQRNTSINNYDIYFAASTNGGTSWGIKYVLNSVVTTTDPLPSIQAASTYEMVVFRYGSGIKSYWSYYTTPTDQSYWVVRNTGFSTSYSPTVTSAYQSPYYYFPMAMANSSDNHVYYYYFDPSTQNWAGGPNNLSLIVPGGGSHLTPSLTSVPGTSQMHVAWKKLIGSGSSIYDHLIIHRRSTNYYSWPNEWTGTYYNSQENPSISALATNKVDLLYNTPSQFGTQTIYKMRFNGTYWNAPSSVASNGRFPSISSGSTTSKYVWTSGSSSPYTVILSTETLQKELEDDPLDYYSRSVAWLDSVGSYLEIRLHPIYLTLKDGTKKRIDILPADLETYNLALSNSWNLLSSVPIELPSDAEELVFDYSISGSGLKNLFNEPLSDVNPIFGLTNEKGEVISSKTQNYIVDTDKIQEVRKQVSVNLFGLSNQKNTKAVIKLDGLNPREGVFASLGHIEDYTSLADKYEKQSEVVQEVAKVNGYDLGSHPNPFNPTATISYSLPEKGQVKINVFDILGREITELVNEVKERGNYTVSFDGNNLSSGVYICTMVVNDYKASTKLILAK